jgi:superfamily II DNA or RNA helicase
MTKITIEKYNESHIRVYGDPSVEMEIKERFSFMAPNYKHHPKYKARIWDGRIHMYNLGTKKLPFGLIHKVEEFCGDNDYEITYKNFPDEGLLITPEELESFITNLDIRSKGNQIEVRDYQFDCILESINSRRLVSKVPTSGGKSLIIYIIMRWLLENELRFMLIVPNITLVNQMFSDFVDYSSANGFDVDYHCHKLHGGEAKEFQKDVLISTWQSIDAINRKTDVSKVLNTYDAVCIDECHQAASAVLTKLLEKMVDVGFRFGTTGTVNPEAVNELTITGHIGPIYSAISTKELIDRGQVSDILIKSIVLKYSDEERKLVKEMDYQAEMDFLCNNKKRNEFITNIAIASSGTTLVLVQYVEKHALPLYEMIKAKSNRPVYYVTGGVSGKEREEIRQKANKEDCIIIASYQTMSTGVNVPNIRNVIFGSPSKSMIRILQSIGRGLRLHKDKDRMVLIDIVDDLKFKKSKNYTLTHFEERLKIYQIEQFPIKIIEIELNR